MKRDFDFEVRIKAEEMTQRKEKELTKKFKMMFEKEKRDMENKF